MDESSVVALETEDRKMDDKRTPQTLISDEDRLLLDKLGQIDAKSQFLLKNIDASTSLQHEFPNISMTLDRLNVESPHSNSAFISEEERSTTSSASSSENQVTIFSPSRISRNQSADSIMLKSSLARKCATEPRKVKSVSFSDFRDESFPKQLSVPIPQSSEVQRLQKEVEELRKKLYEIQPAKEYGNNEAVVVEVPSITDETDISIIINMVASQLNLSTDVIKQDFEIMNKSRIKNVAHLKILISNSDLWKQFELPILEKCAIEQLMKGEVENNSSWLWMGIAAIVATSLAILPSPSKQLFRFFEDLFEL